MKTLRLNSLVPPSGVAMTGLMLGLVALLAACSKPAEAPASGAPDAAAFLDDLYSHYSDGTHMSFSPLNDQAPNYFDPDMVALMKADAAHTPAGDVGTLDGDPICNCQDFGSLTADIKVAPVDATHADADVAVTENNADFNAGGSATRKFIYELTLVNGAWRIHDIRYPDGSSLRGLFINAQQQSASSSQVSALNSAQSGPNTDDTDEDG